MNEEKDKSSSRQYNKTEKERSHEINPVLKYDLQKIIIKVNDHHSYILSRYLIARQLSQTLIPYSKAVSFALTLKIYLIDKGIKTLTQSELYATIENILLKDNLSNEKYISRFKTLNDFSLKKIPMLIVIGGAPCTGKSELAMSLSQRLNIPNILQSDLIFEIFSANEDTGIGKEFWIVKDNNNNEVEEQCDKYNEEPHQPAPVTKVQTSSSSSCKKEELKKRYEHALRLYKEQCKQVWDLIEPDITKSLKDGKPLLINGLHLDPIGFIKTLKNSIRKLFGVDSLFDSKCPPMVTAYFLVTAEKNVQEVFMQNWECMRKTNETSFEFKDTRQLLQNCQSMLIKTFEKIPESYRHKYIISYSAETKYSDILNEMHEKVLDCIEDVSSGLLDAHKL